MWRELSKRRSFLELTVFTALFFLASSVAFAECDKDKKEDCPTKTERVGAIIRNTTMGAGFTYLQYRGVRNKTDATLHNEAVWTRILDLDEQNRILESQNTRTAKRIKAKNEKEIKKLKDSQVASTKAEEAKLAVDLAQTKIKELQKAKAPKSEINEAEKILKTAKANENYKLQDIIPTREELIKAAWQLLFLGTSLKSLFEAGSEGYHLYQGNVSVDEDEMIITDETEKDSSNVNPNVKWIRPLSDSTVHAKSDSTVHTKKDSTSGK